VVAGSQWAATVTSTRKRATSVSAGAAQREVAAYIADLAGDLAQIARRHGFDTLGYLLEMARLEAEAATGRVNAVDPPIS
jgi:hypothetical protein